jgi:ABC-type multidrug transport system ATPase subunit
VPDEDDDALAALVRRQRARGERVIVDLSGGASGAAEQQCDRIAVLDSGTWIIKEA